MESPSSLAESSFSVEVTNLADLERVAARVAIACRGGEVIYLTGSLGAGKTTFVQNMAQALHITDTVNSPTFLIFKEYTISSSKLSLVHADAYRVSGIDDLASTGMLDKLGKPDTVCTIEWPERVADLEHHPHIHLTFTFDNDIRKIKVMLHGSDATHRALWEQLQP